MPLLEQPKWYAQETCFLLAPRNKVFELYVSNYWRNQKIYRYFSIMPYQQEKEILASKNFPSQTNLHYWFQYQAQPILSIITILILLCCTMPPQTVQYSMLASFLKAKYTYLENEQNTQAILYLIDTYSKSKNQYVCYWARIPRLHALVVWRRMSTVLQLVRQFLVVHVILFIKIRCEICTYMFTQSEGFKQNYWAAIFCWKEMSCY